jgi:integrase
MPREGTGTFETRFLVDGTRAFHLRVSASGDRITLVLHERAGCTCGCGGRWDEPGARTELGNVIARVRAGVWERPVPPRVHETDERDGATSYDDYARNWLQGKIEGLIGDRPLAATSESDYRWRLAFSRSFFAGKRVEEIDRDDALAFKAHLIATSRANREAIAAGADLRDRHGRQLVPLSPASIKKIIQIFAAVLDEAVEDRLRPDNPARSRRMRIRVPKPKRPFLEMDELAALFAAARDQDVPVPDLRALDLRPGSTAEKVARLAATGLRPGQIAEQLTISKGNVTYHLHRLGLRVGRGYIGRRAICELLGRGGLRVSELCDLKIGDVRLHAAEGARFRIVDAKTEAGERVVEATPALTQVLIEHLDRLRRAGMPTGPGDYLMPNSRGGRISRQRVRAIVATAADLASERLLGLGFPPLPKTSPHALRRTYISVALVANNFDLEWVMSQVGHTDSKMTMDVYAQLQQRVKRQHGEHFDQLIRGADEELAGLARRPGAGSIGDELATSPLLTGSKADREEMESGAMPLPI